MPGPVARLPRRLLMALVRGYRFALSPWLGSSCRFEPSCSAYALQALEAHGAAVGSALTLMRLARCHPGCAGGDDPVPDHPLAYFTRFLRIGATHRAAILPSSLPDKTLP